MQRLPRPINNRLLYIFSIVMVIGLTTGNIGQAEQIGMEFDDYQHIHVQEEPYSEPISFDEDINGTNETNEDGMNEDEMHEPEARLLMDMNTGRVILSENAEKQLYPASLTKVMTALLALESGQLDEIATTSEKARYQEGSRIYLEEGEQKTIRELLFGLMLNSGNDAAVVIAEHLAGNVDAFVEQMNARAKELGATDTNFVNANGLHDDNHYSTAKDIALIAQEAMKHPLFQEIVTTQTMPWNGDEWVSNLVNTNRLLWEYDDATGIKTGYTSKAMNTLVASAERDNMSLLAVVMKVPLRNQLWEESIQLFEYGFDRYETIKIQKEGNEIRVPYLHQEITLAVAKDLWWTVERDADADPLWSLEYELHMPKQLSPLTAGLTVGTLRLIEDDHIYHEVPLKLTEEIRGENQLTGVPLPTTELDGNNRSNEDKKVYENQYVDDEKEVMRTSVVSSLFDYGWLVIVASVMVVFVIRLRYKKRRRAHNINKLPR